jgi:transcription initiation factor TFIIIB Brf1 subunit/transcription initiation factor TFIIB
LPHLNLLLFLYNLVMSDPFGLLAGIDLAELSAWSEPKSPMVQHPEKNVASSCTLCGSVMCRTTSDLEYVCADCGRVVEGDSVEPEDDAPRQETVTARLRIVGPNGNQLQPDLYRSGSANSAVTQKKQIYEEYCAYRAFYIEAGGRAFPLDICKLASEFYNDVQRQCVKRSQNKKSIMAACFYHACLERNFSPSKAEIAAFMQLPTKGIARGSNFVRSLVADGKMDVDIDADPCKPEINTLFAQLGLESDAYDQLREVVYEIVQIAIKNNIGTSSILRSKVAGATFVVLRRCRDRSLILPIGLQKFCQDRIRKNTVERFTRQLDAYHSYFEPCYIKAGLDSKA